MLGQPLLGEGHDQDAVGGGDADAHDGAHQRRHAERGAGEEQKDHDARQRSRQRGNDDEGIEPRLEVHDDQQVDEHDREPEPREQPDVRGPHRGELAAHGEEAAPREQRPVHLDEARHVAPHRAEIAVLHGAVDVHDPPDVVVRQHRHLARPRDGGHVGQDAGPGGRGGAGDRDVLQVVQGLDAVLRRLGGEVVVDAVLPVQEEGRRRLEAAAQRHQQAAGEVAGREAALGGLRAVDGDVELRIVEALLDPEVHQPRHLAQLVQHLVRHAAVALDVRALDLHVDRRRQAEVDDLRDDVGRQEIERHAGELRRQPFPERADVVGGGPVAGLQRHQDVGVGGADDAGGAVHPVDGAVGQPDVVEDHVELAGGDLAPDGGLDEVGQPGRLLDPRAGRRPQVQSELAAVGVRKEVLAEPRHQQEGGQAGDEEHRDEDDPPLHQPREQPAVGEPHPLEPPVERLLAARERIARGRLALDGRGQQVHGQRRHQRARQQVRGEHRENHRLRERHEEVAGGPAQQEHRQEHDADAERGDQRRHRDLLGAVQDGLPDRFAHVEVAVDVLDLHGGVVHQDADGECQPAERHDVDGLAEQAQRDHRG